MQTHTPYTPPVFKASAFNCPYCGAYANMVWLKLQSCSNNRLGDTPLHMCYCNHCKKNAYWIAEPDSEDFEKEHIRMLVPDGALAPMPHPDMPDKVRLDYEEARTISANSPRGSSALLRLAIQKLCVFLGQKGENVNDDIASLVRKGLPVEIQQALDIVRVVGNNAVHPGELSENDVAAVSASLFELVNQIVEEKISRPKKLQELFGNLPEGARKAIEKRDKK